MSGNSIFDCYSQRMLNPFRGSMNCVTYRSADAVSADGVHWDIYVSNEELVKDLPDGRRPQISDIRFGNWSHRRGLRRGPRFPSDDFLRMEALGQKVYEYLLEIHDQIPFPFRDNIELWLLDREQRPLVLLDSTLALEDMDLDQSLRWTAGLDCRHSFTSTAVGALGIDDRLTGAVADYLTNYINGLAGDEPSAQVFQRHADGHGTAIAAVNLEGKLSTRTLDGCNFPDALINENNHDEMHRQLIADFIRWQAPWQLLLPIADADQRSQLEQHARVQPLKVARQYLLYPEIVDQALIDAARVEARLRESLPASKEPEKIMSTFYIELNPESVD